MQGRWWRASSILTVAVVIVVVVSSAAVAVAGGVAAACHAGAALEQLVRQLAALPAHAIVYPLPSAVCISMYHDFRLRRADGELAAGAEASSDG